jgi:hypothetical protein
VRWRLAGRKGRASRGRSRRVPMHQLRITGIGRPMPARRLTARHLVKPQSGGEALGPENLKRERRLKSQPTGGLAEQATNTARGKPGHRSGLAALSGFRQASVSRGAGVHGSFRARRSARPRHFRAARHQRRRARAAKKQGRRSVGCLIIESDGTRERGKFSSLSHKPTRGEGKLQRRVVLAASDGLLLEIELALDPPARFVGDLALA